jgi:hypothetical protein
MTSKEYIEQQIAAGYDIHFHDGVWWQKKAPFFYQPVHFFQKLVPGEAKPKLLKSFLGYSHLVNNNRYANKKYQAMILSATKLRQFSLECLPQKRRTKVRKGFRLLEVGRINDLKDVIDDIKDICISMSKRTHHGFSPQYYVDNYKKWKSFMLKEFGLPNREWWGAFYKDQLVAYTYSFLIEKTMYGSVLKSHTDYLNMCPNDALEFTLIEHCKNLKYCTEINVGDVSIQSIDKFKESFGYERVYLPMYAKYHPFVFIAKTFNQFSKSIIKKRNYRDDV